MVSAAVAFFHIKLLSFVEFMKIPIFNAFSLNEILLLKNKSKVRHSFRPNVSSNINMSGITNVKCRKWASNTDILINYDYNSSAFDIYILHFKCIYINECLCAWVNVQLHFMPQIIIIVAKISLFFFCQLPSVTDCHIDKLEWHQNV